MTLRYYEQVKDHLHPHLPDFIMIIEMETLSVYRYIMAVIV